MRKPIKVKRDSQFYKNFNEVQPSLIFGLGIITLGLYHIFMIYKFNEDIENLDYNHSPHARRGVLLLFTIPLFYFMINRILVSLFSLEGNLITTTVFNVFWLILILAQYKYFYDFTLFLGKIIEYDGRRWFYFSLIAFPGFIGLLFQIKYLIFFLLILLLLLPWIQYDLNKFFKVMNYRNKSSTFYS